MKFEQLKHFKELLDKTFISQPDISPKPGQVLSVSDSKEIVWKDTAVVEVEEYATNEEIDLLFGPKLLAEFTFGNIDIVSPLPPPRILMNNEIITRNISTRDAVEPIYIVPPILPSCFSVKLSDESISVVDETYFTKYTLKYVINDDYEFILTEADYFGGNGDIEPILGPNFEQKMIDYNSHIKEGVINNIKIYDIDNTVTSFNSLEAVYLNGMNYVIKDILKIDMKALSCQGMFGYIAGNINFDRLDTSMCKNMSYMFAGSKLLPELDLSKLNTNNVTDMSNMFIGSVIPPGLDLSKLNTSNVTDMSYMFGDSIISTLDLSKLNTSNVTDMSRMFKNCKISSLDISNLDTSNVTDMGYMFNGCTSLTTLDLSNFDTSEVENMYSLFGGCSSLTSLNIANFNLVKTTQTKNMFLNTTALTRANIVLTNVSPENITKLEAAGMPKVV